MADHVSPEGRSRIMRAIRSAHTKPELIVRKLLHSQGYRYRLHRRDLPGKPDIVFPSRKKIIFVHGCFWHQHESSKCQISQKPRSNKNYWLPKLERNKQRDREAQDKLKALGWKVLVLWECEVKFEGKLQKKVNRFLGSR